MEAMENGTTPPTPVQNPEIPADGSRLKSFLDQNILKLKLKARDNADPNRELGFENGVEAKRSNFDTKISSEQSSYMDMAIVDKVFDDMPHSQDTMNFGRRTKPINGLPNLPMKSKAKASNSSKIFDKFDTPGVFHQQDMERIKKAGKFSSIMDSEINRSHPNDEFWVKASNNNYDSPAAPGFRAKYWAGLNPRPDSRPAMQGSKRGRISAVEEIVESIKVLGEGLVRMERAKMEMAREMEANRMEMEMKRNEMILESQKQIVDAFVKGLFELKKKNKKVKTDVIASESTEAA